MSSQASVPPSAANSPPRPTQKHSVLCEARPHNLEEVALSVSRCPWEILSVSYTSSLTCRDGLPVAINLSLASNLLGPRGSCHTLYRDNSDAPLGSLVFQGADMPQRPTKSGTTNPKKSHNLNFVLIKLEFGGLSLCLKLYTSGYFQLYGVAPLTTMTADAIATSLLNLFVSRLNASVPSQQLSGWSSLQSRICATHPGTCPSGLGIDVDALEKLYSNEPGLSCKRNPRNSCLSIKFGKGRGSQMFFGTGTMQLFGVDGDPNAYLESFLTLIRQYPELFVKHTKPPRQRKQERKACGKRRKADEQLATRGVEPKAVSVKRVEIEQAQSGKRRRCASLPSTGSTLGAEATVVKLFDQVSSAAERAACLPFQPEVSPGPGPGNHDHEFDQVVAEVFAIVCASPQADLEQSPAPSATTDPSEDHFEAVWHLLSESSPLA